MFGAEACGGGVRPPRQQRPDRYYGSDPLKNAYATLHGLYEAQGLTEEQIKGVE